MLLLLRKKLRDKILGSKRGVTLVETMVSVFIFSMIIGGLYTVLLVGQSSWQVNKVKIELQQELRKAFEWMEYDLREAGTSSVINVLDDGNPQTSIVFRIPQGVDGGAIVWETDTIEFILGGAGNRQLLKNKGVQSRVLAQDISSLSFVRYSASPSILEISITAQKTTDNGVLIQQQGDYSIQLRNH